MNATQRYEAGNWKTIRTDRKSSAIRQIHASLIHLHAGEYECSVTLALAAEDQVPTSDKPYLWNALKAAMRQEDLPILNDLRNWLKHQKEPKEREISEFEVAIALVRAISKFYSAYGEETKEMQEFIIWCVGKKLINPS